MKIHRLLNTSVMRIALRYAGINAVLLMLGLGLLFWAGSRYVDEQISTGLKQRATELVRLDRAKGRNALIEALNSQQTLDMKYPRHFLLITTNGHIAAGDLKAWPRGLEHYGRVTNVWIDGRFVNHQGESRDGYWPMIAERLPDGTRLLLAQGLEQAEELQEVILSTIVTIFLVSVGLALTMGWFIGRTLLARIDNINATAQAITRGDLSRRIPLGDKHDEFDELAMHLNTMLLRIEHLLNGMRQVTDNVAHDLRKPLSRLRNRLEITLLEKREPDEYRQVMSETIEDADDLIRTFNALLEIAQTEAGSFRGEWKTVDLSSLLTELGELYREQAETENKTLLIHVANGLQVTGNRHLLTQAVSNLLDNAIKFTPTAGKIVLAASQQEKLITVQISDNGPGIPDNLHTFVLERFSRLDAARSTSGNGLGLSLVKAVTELHRAELQMTDNQSGLRLKIIFSKATLIKSVFPAVQG